MKFFILIFRFVGVIQMCLLLSINGSAIADSDFSDITGNLEYCTKDGQSIMRIPLPSTKIENVFSIGHGFIFSHDTIKDESMRALSIATDLGEPRELALLRKGKLSILTNAKAVSCLLPAFSHDGRQIACINERGIFLWNLESASERISSDFLYDKNSKPSWTPDDKTIVVSSDDWHIYLVDIVTGARKEIINFGRRPAVSRDGKKIAYLSRESDEEDKKLLRQLSRYAGAYDKFLKQLSWWKRLTWDDNLAIYIYDIATGKSERITDYLYIDSPLTWSPDNRYLAYTELWAATTRNIYVLNVHTHKVKKIRDLQGYVMAWTDN